jgi:hypothetical protein
VLAVLGALALVGACGSGGDDPGSGPSPGAAPTTAPDPVGTGTDPAGEEASGGYLVFNAQGNHLDAYAPEPPFATQRVITSRAESPTGLDVNGQICFVPDGSGRFIAGEDTGQREGDLQGWGVFELRGGRIGEFSATQVGKLVPTYQPSADNPENYGCGFLSDGRVVTTDVGNQASGTGDGQLIIWFPPFDRRDVAYCKLDVEIATAQSIWVDDRDRIHVASARPPTAGVWRYDGPYPTGPDAAGGCGRTDTTGAPVADRVRKELLVPAGEHDLLSPSGLAAGADGRLYVSSVANGVINEYDPDGTFVRVVLRPPPGERILGPVPLSTGTPLGLGVGPDGTLFYADIGIVNRDGDIGPGERAGSVRRIVFVDGRPQPPETVASGLAFPDGIGILTRAPAEGSTRR